MKSPDIKAIVCGCVCVFVMSQSDLIKSSSGLLLLVKYILKYSNSFL